MNDTEDIGRFAGLVRRRMMDGVPPEEPQRPLNMEPVFTRLALSVSMAAVEADREMRGTGIHDQRLFDAGVTMLTLLGVLPDRKFADMHEFAGLLAENLKAEGLNDREIGEVLIKAGYGGYTETGTGRMNRETNNDDHMENEKRKSKVICVDFDGTCVMNEWPEVGRNIGAEKALKLITDLGHRIVLLTMRDGEKLEAAVKWFADNGIPLYGVNRNPDQEKWSKSPKVYGDFYIDDQAVGCPLCGIGHERCGYRPFVDWRWVLNYLLTDLCTLDEWNRLVQPVILGLNDCIGKVYESLGVGNDDRMTGI